MGNFAPRALSPSQIVCRDQSVRTHVLIEALEARACLAAENSETIDVADYWFVRAAELREAAR